MSDVLPVEWFSNGDVSEICDFQDEMDEDQETQQTSVDNYTGVAIKVGVFVMVYSVR